MRSLLLSSLVSVLFACGAPPEGCDGPDAGAPASCEPMGRTCDSAFGVYVLETTGPDGCKPTGSPVTLELLLFDGGVGAANWPSYSAVPMTRMGCQYVSRFASSSETIEFTYEPACNVLRGRVRLYSSACSDGGGAWYDVVGRKP